MFNDDEIRKKINTELELKTSQTNFSPPEEMRRKILEEVKSKGITVDTGKNHLMKHMPEKGNFSSINAFNLDQLLQLEDKEFLVNAYVSILNREPDEEAYIFYLKELRNLKMNKLSLLGILRFSDEGKRNNVNIPKLKYKYYKHKIARKIYKIPVIGYFLEMLNRIIALPKLYKELQKRQADCFALLHDAPNISDFDNLKNDLGNLKNDLGNLKNDLGNLKNDLGNLKNDLGNLKNDLGNLGNLKTEFGELNDYFNNFTKSINGAFKKSKEYAMTVSKLSENKDELLKNLINMIGLIKKLEKENTIYSKKIQQFRITLLSNERKLALLMEEIRKRHSDQLDVGQINVFKNVENSFLDALYVSFEDQFRGTREEIKERQQFYLKYIPQNAKVIDIGCGRGEWLELLQDNHIDVIGVDLNEVMVATCLDLGLNIVHKNALEYLREQKSVSVDVITGFQVVEHLEMDILVKIFDEARRVLKHGGLVIFETPNPENILVGTCNFYFDPTHKNPIPPMTLSYLLEARGFDNLEIVRLSPCHFFTEDEESVHTRLKDLFNKEQDYSVVAYKL